MSQRAALLISMALTTVILLVGVGLTARVMKANAESASAASAAADANDVADAGQAQEQVYQETLDRLHDVNAALATSYEGIASLLDRADRLRAENAELRARETLYQERLTEANSRLEGQGQVALSTPATGQDDAVDDAPTQEADVAPAAPVVASVPAPVRAPQQVYTGPAVAQPDAADDSDDDAEPVDAVVPAAPSARSGQGSTPGERTSTVASTGPRSVADPVHAASGTPSAIAVSLFAPSQGRPFEQRSSTSPAATVVTASAPPAPVARAATTAQPVLAAVPPTATPSARTAILAPTPTPVPHQTATPSHAAPTKNDGDNDHDDRRTASKDHRNGHDRD